jgi:hypothetical protein
MRTIWQSLAWKEWHEHKWKLASITAITCGTMVIALLLAPKSEADWVGALLASLLMSMVPLSVFVGAVEAAGERGGGTLVFMGSLPVPRWKVGLWKLALGAATCLLPILFALALFSCWYVGGDLLGVDHAVTSQTTMADFGRNLPINSPLIRFVVMGFVAVGGVALSLFLWTAAVGVNRRSEVSAGALAVVVVVFWWAAILWLAHATDLEWNGWLGAAASMPPGGINVLLEEGHRWGGWPWLPVGAAIASHAAMAAWYVVRFGRTESIATWSRQSTRVGQTGADWLSPPRRSPLTAIVWKQLRESGRIVLVGWAVVVLLVALTSGVEPNLPVTVMIYGAFLTALILGIGVFDSDLSPRLNAFWRSRPINPDLWYWTKCLTGVAVLTAAVIAPAIAIWTWLLLHGYFPASWRWWDVLPALTFMLAVYAMALGTICLVRMTVYAAILSVAALGTSVVVAWFLHKADVITAEHVKSAIVITTIAAAAVATVLGWLAVRRDWGWRR